MDEFQAKLLEVFLGVIGIPWCVFVTTNIFTFRQQLAVMKSELNLLKEIKDIMKHQRRVES